MTDPTLPRQLPNRSTTRRTMAVVAVALAALTGACSSGSEDDERGSATTDPAAASTTSPDETDGADETNSADETDPEGWIEHESDGISIEHPEAWTVAEDPRAAIILMLDPEGREFRRNINIVVQPGAGTLAEYVELSDGQLETSATEVSDSSSTTLDDEPAQQWRYTMTSSGVDVEVLTVATVKDGTAYLVTYTSDPASFDEPLPDVERSMATVELP